MCGHPLVIITDGCCLAPHFEGVTELGPELERKLQGDSCLALAHPQGLRPGENLESLDVRNPEMRARPDRVIPLPLHLCRILEE